jgi:hypothetical protein
VGAEFPSLWLLEIGRDFEPPYRDDTAFIAVPHKLVELEDGSKIEVPPFEIAKYVVSISQFDRFTRETGYKTTAEQRGYESFRDNPFVGEIPAHKRSSMAAFYISYRDASAYCAWAKVRLPTEAEWVAAAVIDDPICGDDEESDRLLSELRKEPAVIVMEADEMTGTVVDGRSVVIRSGPYLVRCQRYLRSPLYRRHRALTNCEDFVVFRVCK